MAIRISLLLILFLAVAPAIAEPPDVISGKFSDQDIQQPTGSTYTALVDIFGVVQVLNYQKIGDDAVIGGDMIIGPHADVQRRSVNLLAKELLAADRQAIPQNILPINELESIVKNPGFEGAKMEGVAVWPNGRVPYRIASSIRDPDLLTNIAAAIEMWNSYGIVKFIPAGPGEVYVLKFTDVPDSIADDTKWYCDGSLGYNSRKGGTIRLNPPCNLGAVKHEIAHALGMMHEHQRPDRDQFISVDPGVDRTDFNYRILAVSGAMTAYDICSIVHYQPGQTPLKSRLPWFSLTDEGKRQLKLCAKDLPADCRVVGQRCQPSDTDLAFLRHLYTQQN